VKDINSVRQAIAFHYRRCISLPSKQATSKMAAPTPSPSTPAYTSSPPSTVAPPVKKTTKETHPNLPPGLILGPDGKPCKACNSWRDWSKAFAKPRAKAEGSKQAVGMAGMFGAAAGVGATATPAPVNRDNCPPDTEALGRSTWTFLHTTAAYYPLSAPEQTQRSMLNLLSSVSVLYPCAPCASDFRDDMAKHPAAEAVRTREGLMQWLCERHNEVNEKLGKPAFGCEGAQARWRDGPADGSCD
jgi:FAD-linked sulfhydryl oxidase